MFALQSLSNKVLHLLTFGREVRLELHVNTGKKAAVTKFRWQNCICSHLMNMFRSIPQSSLHWETTLSVTHEQDNYPVILVQVTTRDLYAIVLVGIHPTTISEAFQKAAGKSVEILETMATSLQLSDRESLLKSASTSLNSKVSLEALCGLRGSAQVLRQEQLHC